MAGTIIIIVGLVIFDIGAIFALIYNAIVWLIDDGLNFASFGLLAIALLLIGVDLLILGV